MKLHPLIEEAGKVLEGIPLDRPLALSLAREIHGEDLLDLISLANKVRRKFSPPFQRCSIINAKSGRCQENCRFCAQSGHNCCPQVENYPVLEPKKVLEAARKVYDQGVRSFGYVTSGRGWSKPDQEFQKILDTLDLLHREMPDLHLCASLGILSEECVALLAKHHVWRYNMNLQTNPEKYGDLVATTHTVQEKIQTIRLMQKYGITNCTGGIIGLGESWEDRIDMALAIRELKVECSPLNVLLPIPGTKLQEQSVLAPAEVAKSFALFRLLLPTQSLKFCAGRETVMKDFQGLLMLAGLNSLMTGGYLTTRGREIKDDERFIQALGGFGM